MVYRNRAGGFGPALILGAAIFAHANTALAKPVPVAKPNGTISGTVDGNAFDLPVFCKSHKSIGLFVTSHTGTNHGVKSVQGVEPLISIVAPSETAFEFIGFMGGKRFKFLRVRDGINAFPFVFAKKVRARDHGKIRAEFTLDCPNP